MGQTTIFPTGNRRTFPCGIVTRYLAEARFTSRAENCYTTNQSQESTCLTMLHNECCVGYWKAG